VFLVLDACEHVREEAARIASTLLAECARMRILSTSRETLHVAGEVRLPVAPLGAAATDLFLERARVARTTPFASSRTPSTFAARIRWRA